MPNLLSETRVTRTRAVDILERVYVNFLTPPMINLAGEWDARQTVARCLSQVRGLIEDEERLTHLEQRSGVYER